MAPPRRLLTFATLSLAVVALALSAPTATRADDTPQTGRHADLCLDRRDAELRLP